MSNIKAKELMPEKLAKDVRWDLSDLYASVNDPKIEQDLDSVEAKAVLFEKKYKTLFDSDTAPDVLSNLLKDYKEIAEFMAKLGVFAHLSFAEKTNDPSAGA